MDKYELRWGRVFCGREKERARREPSRERGRSLERSPRRPAFRADRVPVLRDRRVEGRPSVGSYAASADRYAWQRERDSKLGTGATTTASRESFARRKDAAAAAISEAVGVVWRESTPTKKGKPPMGKGRWRRLARRGRKRPVACAPVLVGRKENAARARWGDRAHQGENLGSGSGRPSTVAHSTGGRHRKAGSETRTIAGQADDAQGGQRGRAARTQSLLAAGGRARGRAQFGGKAWPAARGTQRGGVDSRPAGAMGEEDGRRISRAAQQAAARKGRWRGWARACGLSAAGEGRSLVTVARETAAAGDKAQQGGGVHESRRHVCEDARTMKGAGRKSTGSRLEPAREQSRWRELGIWR
ncbi:unnamed protein product [Closterium sp. NIES-64]|nr:unnamed protein product [Closterium sp. NIES-64]